MDLIPVKEVTHHAAGERARDLRPGDILICRGTSVMSRLISLWQRGPLGGYTHAGVSRGGSRLAEALIDGVKPTHLEDWDSVEYAAIRLDACCATRARMTAYMDEVLEREYEYGFLTIAGLALTLLSGGKLYVAREGSAICSGFAAATLVRGPSPMRVWFDSPAAVTPQRIAAASGVEPGPIR